MYILHVEVEPKLAQNKYFIKPYPDSSIFAFTPMREWSIYFQMMYPVLTLLVRANDITVPYVTGAIELEDPFADLAASGVHLQVIFYM